MQTYPIMPLFNPQIQEQLRGILAELQNPVHLVYFTQEFECGSCAEGRQFVEEINALSDKISLEIFEFVQDNDEAEAYGVARIPAIIVLDKEKTPHGIRFYGVPGGYEINSFLAALKEVGGGGEKLPEELLQRIKEIKNPIHDPVRPGAGAIYLIHHHDRL